MTISTDWLLPREPFKGDSYLHRGEMGSGHFLSRSRSFANSVQMWVGGGEEEMKQEKERVTDGELEGLTRIIQSNSSVLAVEVTSPDPTEVNGRTGIHADHFLPSPPLYARITGALAFHAFLRWLFLPCSCHKRHEACQKSIWGKYGGP